MPCRDKGTELQLDGWDERGGQSRNQMGTTVNFKKGYDLPPEVIEKQRDIQAEGQPFLST